MTKVKITKEAYGKLTNELSELKNRRRVEVAEKLKKAISQGDISENAEYDEAKEESALIEGRIMELNQKLGEAEIVEYTNGSGSMVSLGSSITVVRKKDGERLTYRIVLPDDMDLSKNFISVDSPVGRAVLGRKKGDAVEVEAPAGKLELMISDIK